MTPTQLARVIDHTILKAEATEADVRAVTAEAIAHHFASVCVNGRWVRMVRGMLAAAGLEQTVLTCACVGFPLGAAVSAIKAAEAARAVADGAQEIDMVSAVPALLQGCLEEAQADIAAVVTAARDARPGTVVKVILETALLNEPQIALGCRAARAAGADFVKTSTGFHPRGGATTAAVTLLKRYAEGLKVKAAGGIRDLATANAMLAAGADRLGCSASVSILASSQKPEVTSQ